MRPLAMAAVLAAAMALPGLIVAGKPAAPKLPATLTERNRVVVKDFVDLFYRQRRVRAAFTAHVAPNYVQHNPGVGDGRDAALAFLVPLFSAAPARFDVKHVLVDHDMALVHLHGRPDPSQPGLAVADLYRLHDGKIVEHWDVLQPVMPSTANPHPFF